MERISPSISIVVPVYNEEENIKILYEEIRSSVDPLEKPYEIIFVDDGSSDSTFEGLKAIKKKCEKQNGIPVATRIIRFVRNFGQTAAMQVGFDHAKGDTIVSLDGDLQNDPSDIPRLLTKIGEGYDLVCGWRKNRKDKTLNRVLPSKVANWIIRRITGVSIHDNGCSLKAYRSSVIKSIVLYSDMHRFVPAIATLAGARIAEIVVNHRHRKYGKTKYGLARVWKVLVDIITIKMVIHFHATPILWFSFFALIFGLVGLALGILSVFLFLKGALSIVYSTSCFLFLTLSGSFLAWGLLADFFNRVEKR